MIAISTLKSGGLGVRQSVLRCPTLMTSQSIERAWKTYLKNILFVAPAILFCAVALIFILPKLQTLWRDAGLADSGALWMVKTPATILQNGTLILGLLVGVLAILELAVKPFARFRRGVLGSLAFILNGAALYTLTLMCMAGVMVAPEYANAKGRGVAMQLQEKTIHLSANTH
jgi:hypothetical protein